MAVQGRSRDNSYEALRCNKRRADAMADHITVPSVRGTGSRQAASGFGAAP